MAGDGAADSFLRLSCWGASATSSSSLDEAVPAGLAFPSDRAVAAGMDPLTSGARVPSLLCQLRAGDDPAGVPPALPRPEDSTGRWLQEAPPSGFVLHWCLAIYNPSPGALKGSRFNDVLNGKVIFIWTILLPVA